MSSVIRPSGPLPPSVYWVRRLVLLVAVVLVVAALWWLLSGLGGSQQPSSGPATGATSATTSSPPTALGSTSAQAAGTPSGAHHKAQQPGETPTGQPPHRKGLAGHRKAPPLAQPTGDCAPGDVGIVIDVADTTAGHPVKATLSLTSLAASACTLQVTPDSLVLRITSGADVVWSSDDCPDSLPARQIVVRADPATAYAFRWNGRRSVQGCLDPGAVATPGGYWVEAALVGAGAHKAYFDVAA